MKPFIDPIMALRQNISEKNIESTKQTYLTSYFIAVDEEIAIKSEQYGDHELQLLMEYKSKEVENENCDISERKEKKSHDCNQTVIIMLLFNVNTSY